MYPKNREWKIKDTAFYQHLLGISLVGLYLFERYSFNTESNRKVSLCSNWYLKCHQAWLKKMSPFPIYLCFPWPSSRSNKQKKTQSNFNLVLVIVLYSSSQGNNLINFSLNSVKVQIPHFSNNNFFNFIFFFYKTNLVSTYYLCNHKFYEQNK